MEATEKTTTVERLRQSRKDHEAALAERGKKDGRVWAEHHASYAELVKVDEHLERQFLTTNDASEGCLEFLGELDVADLEDGDSHDEYAFAFLEGALEFFNEHRDEIEAD